jgi:xanthine dehydrogenase large subunit
MRKLIETPAASAPSAQQVGAKVPHESAARHVSGAAVYIDDMPLTAAHLHVAIGKSTQASARVAALNLTAVRSSSGVVDVLTQADIPGKVDIAPVFDGDPLLAGDTIQFAGQAVFAVAATSFAAAQRAVVKALLQETPLPMQQSVAMAAAARDFVVPEHVIARGDCESVFSAAPHTLTGHIEIAGQEHFYLESQIAEAHRTEEGVMVFSSSQHPGELQKLIAEVLLLPMHCVVVEVRRMGGGFGGKETQAALPACLAALFAYRTRRPVRCRLPRKDDMVITGKRHPFSNDYRVAFDAEGRIQAAELVLAADCGCSADLSMGIVDRAVLHADNAYYLPNVRITGLPCRTNKVSNTAFRGFGAPQGMLTTEAMLDDIARAVGRDPLAVRLLNLYQPGMAMTPYGMQIEDSVLPDLMQQLVDSADYWARRAEVAKYNHHASVLRKGLAITPVKFGVSFTTTHLNQAGALVHIYTDGSIHLNHGGTEMGQGLFLKVAQVVATAFGVDVAQVMVTATRTDKVPNASPTAASAGADLNGMAALDACQKIKAGLIEFATKEFACTAETVRFSNGHVLVGEHDFAFTDFIKKAYVGRVPLFSSGFYRTPKIHYNRKLGQGRPFLYFANGAACAEVTVNTMTGEYRVDRVDILHDVGSSLNPAIDLGQIEGGFVQGMGWLTTEDLRWNEQGVLISNSPANYKIPTATDLPPIFNVDLFQRPNGEETIHRSKAVGEPPLMLANAVWCALRDACASVANYRYSPPLSAPATPEQVYWALQKASAFAAQEGSHD